MSKALRFTTLIFTAVLIGFMSTLEPFQPHMFEGAFTLCPFKLLTSVDCPSCGMGRSLIFMSQLNVATAFQYHPLGPILFSGGILHLTASVIHEEWTRKKWGLIASIFKKRQNMYTLIACYLTWWVFRLAS